MSTKPPAQVPAPPQGDEFLGLLLNIFTAWTVGLTVIIVALRLFTRIRLVESKLWWDDYFISAAMVRMSEVPSAGRG